MKSSPVQIVLKWRKIILFTLKKKSPSVKCVKLIVIHCVWQLCFLAAEFSKIFSLAPQHFEHFCFPLSCLISHRLLPIFLNVLFLIQLNPDTYSFFSPQRRNKRRRHNERVTLYWNRLRCTQCSLPQSWPHEQRKSISMARRTSKIGKVSKLIQVALSCNCNTTFIAYRYSRGKLQINYFMLRRTWNLAILGHRRSGQKFSLHSTSCLLKPILRSEIPCWTIFKKLMSIPILWLLLRWVSNI